MYLEFPSEAVPLDSPFYIDRPPIEELVYQEICNPGSVIRIKAPKQMGKSSLLLRLLHHADSFGYRTVYLDFQQAEEAVFTNLDKFLRWFCANVSRQLHLNPMLDDYWDEDMGSKVSCTVYFQDYLLQQIDSLLVLTLNEVNRIFEHPKIAQEFLPLLRLWHGEAKQDEIWQKFRLVVVHSTEVYITLNINQSPFNVGLPIKLPEFSLEQVLFLAQRHGLDWTDGSGARKLMAMVGGHPYLVRLALYHLCRGEVTLEQLLQAAPTLTGIYSDRLREYYCTLQKNPELAAALKQVVDSPNGVELDPIFAYKLEGMGLVKLNGNRCQLSCELYRRYFTSPNLEEDNLRQPFESLPKPNQALQQSSNIDDLTQLANRRYFDTYLEQQWQKLAGEMTPLLLMLCDLDCFKIEDMTRAREAGDDCLRGVASVICQVVGDTDDIPTSVSLVARYEDNKFALILSGASTSRALDIAEKIRDAVKNLAILHDSKIDDIPAQVVTVSLGIARLIPHMELSPSILVRAAEEALVYSKKSGVARVSRISICSNLDDRLLD